MASEEQAAVDDDASPAVRNLVTVSGSGLRSGRDALKSLDPRSASGFASYSGAVYGREGASMRNVSAGNLQARTEQGSRTTCVCGGKRGDWREARFGAGWHDDCQKSEITPKCTGRMCKCAAGLAADCTAVCCCPLSLLHLLVLGLVKLPSIIVYKGYQCLKEKFSRKRRRSAVYEQEDSLRRMPFTITMSSSYREPEPMSPKDGGFGDHAVWREYFGSDGSETASVTSSGADGVKS